MILISVTDTRHPLRGTGNRRKAPPSTLPELFAAQALHREQWRPTRLRALHPKKVTQRGLKLLDLDQLPRHESLPEDIHSPRNDAMMGIHPIEFDTTRIEDNQKTIKQIWMSPNCANPISHLFTAVSRTSKSTVTHLD